MIRLKRLYVHNFKQLREIELCFPDSARILVRGKNEAGKSTLFEAIFFGLFGAGLATEAGGRSLDGLISYEAEKARVELDVASRDRVFKLTRTIVRGRSNVWQLDILHGSDPAEEVRGNTGVNKRLIAELGFDGEALLNTCFVEQKKLEKLEGLSRAKREESLAKLLNLDRMVDLESGIKVRAEDRQELDRLSKRVELAETQSELPEREKQLVAVEAQLRTLALRRAVAGAADEMRSVKRLETELGLRVAERDAATQRAGRLDALKEAIYSVKEARDAAERWGENDQAIRVLEARQADSRRAVDESQQQSVREQELKRLALRLERLEGVRVVCNASADRAAELGAVKKRLAELGVSVEAEERKRGLKAEQIHQYKIGEALGSWIESSRARVTQEQIVREVKAKEAAKERLAGQSRIELFALAFVCLLLVGVAGLLFLSTFAIAGLAGPAWASLAAGGVAVLAALALAVLAARATLLWRRWSAVSAELERARGQALTQTLAGEQARARIRELETQLIGWGCPVPATPDLAQAQRVNIAQAIENKTLDELEGEQAETQARLLSAQAVLGELQQQHALADADPIKVQSEWDNAQKRTAKAQAILARWQGRTRVWAGQCGLEPDRDAIQKAVYQIEAQLEQARLRCTQLAADEREEKRLQEQAADLAVRVQAPYQRAVQLSQAERTDWSIHLPLTDYTSFGKELRAEYDSLGGESALKRARDLENEVGRRQGELETRGRNLAKLVSQAQELLANTVLAARLSAEPSLDELSDLATELVAVELEDEASLRNQQRQLLGRIHSLKDRRTQYERELGLENQVLEPAACRSEYLEQARHVKVRETGVDILSMARRRIVQKVLPATMDYMRQILPTLTRDRYHDAQLDEETYRIQVWDERAGQGGAFKEKNIFSGGTKDQFSLALRLSFALATLPQERGAAPSFIFLDEPLSSFDEERAEALIYLLTEGEIARAFDQIFLISHVHVDERLFTHRVVLENGHVAFSDLPTG